MERSFARGTRYGFDRARWRGLWRMRIQEYLVCTIQNIQTLIKHTAKPNKSIAASVVATKTAYITALSTLITAISSLYSDRHCPYGLFSYKLDISQVKL